MLQPSPKSDRLLGPLLLLPALGGYLFLTHCNATRDSIQVTSGYHVVFRSAVAGIVLFAVCRPLALLVNHLCPEISAVWRSLFQIAYSGTAALTVLFGAISPPLINFFINRMEARRRTAARSSDRVGLIIDRALNTNSLVQVSLNDRKVYTGRPLHRAFDARLHDGDLILIPLWSTHRQIDTLEPQAPTNYAPVIRKALKDGQPLSNFGVAIPLSTVQSVRLFDPSVEDSARGKMHTART